MNAAAIGTAAYYTSLQYAKERPQGRKISEKDPTKPQTAIINHADVKRMLLFQKSITEGSLSLLLYCSKLADLAHVEEGVAKEEALLLHDLLTPIAKSYPSEMCCQTTSAAVQILGGSGYTTDFPVEQYYREARIHPIHEGTTAIHGLDLLGRKMIINNGKAMSIYFKELTKAAGEASQIVELHPFIDKIRYAIDNADKATKHLMAKAANDTESFLADATLFLEMFGIITIAWQWMRQAVAAHKALATAEGEDLNFYKGKITTARYFYEYELVKVDSLAKRLLSNEMVTIDMQTEWF
ncbi:MAG: acyl-CoA dehydrogenase [Spirosomaceae bacterium]|nr:acyl-CoA dehydrogenase [Spirosomataceae bacterium]